MFRSKAGNKRNNRTDFFGWRRVVEQNRIIDASNARPFLASCGVCCKTDSCPFFNTEAAVNGARTRLQEFIYLSRKMKMYLEVMTEWSRCAAVFVFRIDSCLFQKRWEEQTEKEH